MSDPLDKYLEHIFTENADMHVSKNLTNVMKKRNINDSKLAAKLSDVSRVSVTYYRIGARVPKGDSAKELADALDVSEDLFSPANLSSPLGLMYALFECEDFFGLTPVVDGDEVKLTIKTPESGFCGDSYLMSQWIKEWAEKNAAVQNGEITPDEYEQWKWSFGKNKRENVDELAKLVAESLHATIDKKCESYRSGNK